MLIACERFVGIVFAMKAHLTERRPLTLLLHLQQQQQQQLLLLLLLLLLLSNYY